MASFQEMLNKIYHFLSTFSSQEVSRLMKAASVQKWIWHGEGFASPQQVAFYTDFSLDLRPRLFVLQVKEYQGRSEKLFP